MEGQIGVQKPISFRQLFFMLADGYYRRTSILLQVAYSTSLKVAQDVDMYVGQCYVKQ